MLCAIAAAHGSRNVTQFHCFEISPGIGCYSVPYMKIPVNNQIIFAHLPHMGLSNKTALGPDFVEPISLKPLDGFIPF